jgi:catechol 2,3-dioxygenase-like lactoylglutathione lyase family enzyme
MAKIRHIAIHVADQRKVRDFYINTFGMKEVFNQEDRAFYLSDGYINLAILPLRPGAPEHIGHFGFEVEDIAATGRQAAEHGGSAELAARPRDGRFAEYRIADPAGIGIDLSQVGWKV